MGSIEREGSSINSERVGRLGKGVVRMGKMGKMGKTRLELLASTGAAQLGEKASSKLLKRLPEPSLIKTNHISTTPKWVKLTTASTMALRLAPAPWTS